MNEALADLLSLQAEVRKQQSIKALSFFICHQTHVFFNYQRSFVWSCINTQFINIESISGIVELEKQSPFQQQISSLIKILAKEKAFSAEQKTLELSKQTLIKKYQIELPSILPDYFVLTPFYLGEMLVGGACFCLDTKPNEAALKKLCFLLEAYEYSFALLSKGNENYKRFFHFPNGKRIAKLSTLAICFALFAVRVPLSIMVEAEITPKNPVVITAPMDGVIQTVLVHSAQSVKKNTPLFRMETRELTNAYEQAEKEFNVANEYLNKTIKGSFDDLRLRAEITILNAEKEEKQLAVHYAKTLLESATVKATEDAIVIVNSPNEWSGKPVQVGEKIMMTSKKNQIEVTLWLPVSDALFFEKGDPLTLYLNAKPLSPYSAKIDYSNYLAQKTAKDVLAYKMTAHLVNINDIKELPRIGSQGNARISHGTSTLFFYLFRRPITFLRQTVGW